MTENLFTLLRQRVADPDRVLIETLSGRSLTYGATFAGAARVAAVLKELGVEPGDRVVAQVDKSPEALLLYLGCLCAGAVFVPLNTAYTLSELEYFITDADASLVVCRTEGADGVVALCRRLKVPACETLSGTQGGSFAERVGRMRNGLDDVVRCSGDLAALLYTSGTTGRSKGAMLTHGNLASNAETLAELWRFTPDDVLIHALPIFHTHGLFVACNVTMMAGSRMILLARFDAAEVLALARRATVLMGVPTFYTRMLAEPGLDGAAVKTMRLFISGSAPLAAETHKAWTERTGHAILERYGMTETNMNASNPYVGARVPGSVGPPLPGVEIRITQPETGGVLGTDETGMIEIRGPNVFSGYWRMPEKTEAEFRSDGFFISGDLGRIDSSGYLNIVGRAKDLIITGGYNVYPKEVEIEIDAVDGILESAVVGVPHPDLGEAVLAVAVAQKGAVVSERDLIDALKARLAGYKVPKRVLIVEELPRNAMGKVQKAVLRERHAGVFGGPQSTTSARKP